MQRLATPPIVTTELEAAHLPIGFPKLDSAGPPSLCVWSVDRGEGACCVCVCVCPCPCHVRVLVRVLSVCGFACQLPPTMRFHRNSWALHSHAAGLDPQSAIGLTRAGYHCPRCFGKHCELPIECRVCGLQLVASPQLARSYHHLIPVPPFAEVPMDDAGMWGCLPTRTGPEAPRAKRPISHLMSAILRRRAHFLSFSSVVASKRNCKMGSLCYKCVTCETIMVGSLRASPLVRVKVKFTVKTPYVRSLQRQHTAFLTGDWLPSHEWSCSESASIF